MNNDSKMPIVLIGNSFKYEIEATLKLFFNTARFTFCTDRSEIVGDRYVVAGVRDNSKFTVEVCLGSEPVVTDGKAAPDKLEHEICRAIFHTLCRLTGIRPPWGIMTGIRPVKKVTELIERGMDREQIRAELTERFELLPDKFELAYMTAENQLPILEKIDRSAASLYVSIPFCPTRCSYCSFVSHSMDSARKLMPEYIAALCRELEIVGDIVREYGFDYLNYELNFEDTGLDLNRDFYNLDHLNVYGQQKFTGLLTEKLTKDYRLTAKEPSGSQKQEWQTCADYYDAYYRYSDELIQKGEGKELSEDCDLVQTLKSYTK